MEQRYSRERPFGACRHPLVSNDDAVTSHECVKACALRVQCCFSHFDGSARSWGACGCLHLQFETQLGAGDRELCTFLFLVIPLRKSALLLCLMKEEAIAKVHILIRKGSTVTFEAQKKVLLKKASPRILIQPSKPLYKPGEIGKYKSFTIIWNSFHNSWRGIFQNWVSGEESKHCRSGQLKQSFLPGVQILCQQHTVIDLP